MVLKFGNVTLRAIELKDTNLLMELINSPEVESTTVGWNFPVSEHLQLEWIKEYKNNNSMIRWMIELDEGHTLGMIALSDIDWKDRNAHIRYKINPTERNRLKGDTKNALYAVVKYAFEELGLNRIEGNNLDYNVFSHKLLMSVGFVKEGVCRSKIYKHNGWYDIFIFGLIKEDFVHYEDGEAPWQVKARNRAEDKRI